MLICATHKVKTFLAHLQTSPSLPPPPPSVSLPSLFSSLPALTGNLFLAARKRRPITSGVTVAIASGVTKTVIAVPFFVIAVPFFVIAVPFFVIAGPDRQSLLCRPQKTPDRVGRDDPDRVGRDGRDRVGRDGVIESTVSYKVGFIWPAITLFCPALAIFAPCYG